MAHWVRLIIKITNLLSASSCECRWTGFGYNLFYGVFMVLLLTLMLTRIKLRLSSTVQGKYISYFKVN